jgi:hypothetical protein
MPKPEAEFEFRSSPDEEKIGYDGLPLRSVRIDESRGRGYVIYTGGVDVIAALSDITLRDTASLDHLVCAGEKRQGLGKALMREFIKEAKEANFQYASTLLINPLMVRVIEGRLREGAFSDRIYYDPNELPWSVPSDEVFKQFTPLTADAAADAIGPKGEDEDRSPVDCLIRL